MNYGRRNIIRIKMILQIMAFGIQKCSGDAL